MNMETSTVYKIDAKKKELTPISLHIYGLIEENEKKEEDYSHINWKLNRVEACDNIGMKKKKYCFS
jgi:hypothetical protein